MSFRILLLLCLAAGITFGASDPVNFVPVGCYRDNQLKPRPLPDLIHNYRVNNEMDWTDLNSTVIEACARKTLKMGYMYFGIQFYGECWSGLTAHETYSKNGPSNMCINGVGKGFANMVYRLTGKDKECVDYKVLNSEDRSMFYHNVGLDTLCDTPDETGFTEGWYRFQGKAGTRLANKTMKKRCQTNNMAWYNGPYPNVTDKNFQVKACLKKTTLCEKYDYYSLQIKITNCGGFFVYHLPKMPGCSYRYCGNGELPTIKVNL